jgi:hypothetical protein
LKLRSSIPISPAPWSGVRAEVSAGEPARHRGGPPDGSDDRPRQIAREHDDEEDRSAKTAGCHGDSAAGGRLRALLPCHREVLLGSHEAVELGPDCVDPQLAVCDHRHVPRGARVASGGVDQRDRVILDVGRDGHRDVLRAGALPGVVGDQPFERPGLLGKGGLSGPPGFEEGFLSRDEKPALARLEIDDNPLEPVGNDEHLVGLPCARR